MLSVGCAGFPVPRARYWRALGFVEADTGRRMPRASTLAAWQADMPAGAESAVQAYRIITHGPEDRGFPAAGRRLPPRRQALCGAFRESLEAHEAWMATRAAASALGARAVIFETPAAFSPGADRLRDMYRFFKAAARGRLSFVWQPRGREWGSLADKICAELGLIRAFDPFQEPPPQARATFLYLRPLLPRAARLSVDNLTTILSASAGAPSYLALSHAAAFEDAEKLRELAARRR